MVNANCKFYRKVLNFTYERFVLFRLLRHELSYTVDIPPTHNLKDRDRRVEFPPDPIPQLHRHKRINPVICQTPIQVDVLNL